MWFLYRQAQIWRQQQEETEVSTTSVSEASNGKTPPLWVCDILQSWCNSVGFKYSHAYTWQRHLLPFQMGQGDYGPDGTLLPGRPRPHYTYSRKSTLKKSRGGSSAFDLTDEEDDSTMKAVSPRLQIVACFCCSSIRSLRTNEFVMFYCAGELERRACQQ